MNSVQTLWGLSLLFVALGDGDIMYVSILIFFHCLLRSLEQIKEARKEFHHLLELILLSALVTRDSRKMLLIL